MDDQTSITILRAYCDEQKIAINPELHSYEKERKINHNKYKGEALFLETQNSSFGLSQKILSDLKIKFDLKCYVQNEADISNVRAAFTWLFEQAPQSSAAHFWQPALK